MVRHTSRFAALGIATNFPQFVKVCRLSIRQRDIFAGSAGRTDFENRAGAGKAKGFGLSLHIHRNSIAAYLQLPFWTG